MMSKRIILFLIVLSAINLGINAYTLNLGGICGWLVALLAHIQLLEFSGD